jgi:hypothetical protein
MGGATEADQNTILESAEINQWAFIVRPPAVVVIQSPAHGKDGLNIRLAFLDIAHELLRFEFRQNRSQFVFQIGLVFSFGFAFEGGNLPI